MLHILLTFIKMFHKQQLKQLRKSKGFTQEDIADKLFISQSAYARLENGSCKTWGVYLKNLCVIFNVSPVVFINDTSLKDNDTLKEELLRKEIEIKNLKNKVSNLETMVSILEKK